jgi:arsenical pump membrane protein
VIDSTHLAIWSIVTIATAGVIARPFHWPEALWAVGGAAVVVACGLLPLADAFGAIAKGTDVYLFLAGMMLLSECARREGLFDWVATIAVNRAHGSPQRLFGAIYLVGVVVTVFLSNDATAVVLTPAVYAAAKKAKVAPLPYLFVCAFVANAASFVLPISNPANIVLYGDHTPPLGDWITRFSGPSVLAIAATWIALRWTEGRRLAAHCEQDVPLSPLTAGARIALAGIATTAVALSLVSAFDRPLGLPTAILGLATTGVVLLRSRTSVRALVGGVSWSVLPLVAGLFVLVEALTRTGVVAARGGSLDALGRDGGGRAAAMAGATIAFGSNVVNNLPAGLVASTVVQAVKPPQVVVDALLIGVDLGPNLSVTGSLATILWLTAIRREGESVGFWRFLGVGAMVMIPALILALAARIVAG